MSVEWRQDTTRQEPSGLLVARDRSDDPSAVALTVVGEVDSLSGDDLQSAVEHVLREQHPARLQLNLRGVSFLDSAGIRTLVTCRAEAERAGCRLRLTDPHPMAYTVLEMVSLLDHFGIAKVGSSGRPETQDQSSASSTA